MFSEAVFFCVGKLCGEREYLQSKQLMIRLYKKICAFPVKLQTWIKFSLISALGIGIIYIELVTKQCAQKANVDQLKYKVPK